MKAKQKEIKSYIQVYESFDGREFDSSDECRKYENSAAGKLLCDLQGCIVKNDVDFIFDENDENEYKLIIPNTYEDIDTINQLTFIFGTKTKDKLPFNEDDINKPILLGIRMYCDSIDWVWFYNLDKTIKEITDNKFEITENDSKLLEP